ncbi:6777_t:CDS:2 [Entrophospora sp. SA101]|nr:6777_t:CDS:2 [Entrophospora sp. SA101]
MQELGNEFLRYMKSGKASLLTPFNLCCLLSMARIHRFQDLVFNYLKSSIMAVYKDKEKLESAKWISSNYNNNNNHVYFLMLDGYLYNKSLFIFILELDISQIVSLIPLDDLFKKVLKKTSFGYDNVIQSLVQLGTFIMDSTISSASCVKITEKKIGSKTPNEAASDLGVIILLEMFKMHEMVRVEILDQIQSRVVSRSPSVGHFLTLLEIIVKEKPDSLNDYIQRIKGTLDHFSLLPSYIADHLLRALQPIIYRNISIRDGLMLAEKHLNARQLQRVLKLQELIAKEISKPSQDVVAHVKPTTATGGLDRIKGLILPETTAHTGDDVAVVVPKVDQLKDELDDLVASECILCGDLMIKTIEQPFINGEEGDLLASWAI